MEEQKAHYIAGAARDVQAAGLGIGPTDGDCALEGAADSQGSPDDGGGKAGTGGSIALVDNQRTAACYVNPLAVTDDEVGPSEAPGIAPATYDRAAVVVRNLSGSWTEVRLCSS